MYRDLSSKFMFVLHRYFLLYLLCIFTFIIRFRFIVVLIYLCLFTLQNLSMLSIEFIHLFLLVSSSNFFSFAFNILNILSWFCIFLSFLSHFLSMLLLSHKLQFLIFVKPRNSFNINVMLLKRSDTFPQNLLDPWYSEQKEWISYFSYIYVFKFEYVAKIVLLVCTNVRNKSFLGLLNIITIRRYLFVHSRGN